MEGSKIKAEMTREPQQRVAVHHMMIKESWGSRGPANNQGSHHKGGLLPDDRQGSESKGSSSSQAPHAALLLHVILHTYATDWP